MALPFLKLSFPWPPGDTVTSDEGLLIVGCATIYANMPQWLKAQCLESGFIIARHLQTAGLWVSHFISAPHFPSLQKEDKTFLRDIVTCQGSKVCWLGPHQGHKECTKNSTWHHSRKPRGLRRGLQCHTESCGCEGHWSRGRITLRQEQ